MFAFLNVEVIDYVMVQAIVFLSSANVEIERVRKQKEIDLAGIQASLKKATNRVGNLEVEIAQKVCNIIAERWRLG